MRVSTIPSVPTNRPLGHLRPSGGVGAIPTIGVYNLHMIRVNIFLPERVVAALKALSEKTGLSYAEHIRRAIDAYLKKEKP
jgi:hypothetical protein